ncbi:uncharacterized protein [Oscarella lobularis]|uniref:uncharacterized protein isoform X3 n=1 Tax=Oscarella lobularis TaxID=121494 RepID=UPI0033136560
MNFAIGQQRSEFICFLLLCMAVGTAAEESDWCSQECSPNHWWAFRSGTTISYDYKSLAVSTMQGLTSSANGNKFKMTLTYTFHSPCWVEMTIDNVRAFDYNGTWPMTSQTNYKLNTQLTDIYAKFLTKWSSSFWWDDGDVRCVRWSDEEPLWVRNFKRGLISPWQINVKERSSWQTGVTGRCRVSSKWIQRESEVTVSQIRHMGECEQRPRRITSFVRLNPNHKATESSFYGHSSTSWYQLWNPTASTPGWVFKNITVDDQYVVTPLSKYGGGPVTFVRQAYSWREGPLTSSNVKPNCRRLACASLLYEFPESDPKVQCQNDVKHRIERSLQILLDNFEQPESIGYGRVFQTAVYDIRQACHKQLINLWKHFTHRNEYKKREIYLDALGFVCTEDSITFLKDKILGNEVDSKRARSLLVDTSFCNQTSPTIVNTIKELSVGVGIYEDDTLQCGAWFTLGSHVHRLGHAETESEDAVDYLLREIDRNRKATTERSLVCLVDAIRNSGSPRAFDDLWDIAQQTTLSIDVRVSAITALERMIEWIPREIQQRLLSIWSVDKSSEVRIAAWDVLMETVNDEWPIPWFDYIELVEALKTEPNQRVATYVWSWLQAWASNPELDEQWARFAQYSLRASGAWYWGRKFNVGYYSSKFAVQSVSLADFGLAVPVDAAAAFVTTKVVFDEGESTLPRTAIANVYVLFLGQKIPLITVKGSADEASWMLEHLFGPTGYFATNKSGDWDKCVCLNWKNHQCESFEEKTPSTRFSIAVLNRELYQWHWTSRDMTEYPFYNLTDVLWSMFLKGWWSGSLLDGEGFTAETLFDLLQRFRQFNVGKFLWDGTLWDTVYNFNKTMMPLEVDVSTPTILGLPLRLSARLVSHVSVETEGRVFHGNDETGVWYYRVWNAWNNVPNFHGFVTIRPRMTLEFTASMDVDVIYGSSSIEMTLDLSSNNAFDFDFELEMSARPKVSLKALSKNLPSVVASYRTEIAFSSQTVNVSKQTWPVLGNLELVEDYVCFGKEYLGTEMCLEWQGYNSSGTWAPYYPMNGPSFANLQWLASTNSFNDSCDGDETYETAPNAVLVTLEKNADYNFTLSVKGAEAVPKREIRVDASMAKRGSAKEYMSVDLTWTATRRTGAIRSLFEWSRAAVNASWWVIADASRSAWSTFGTLNRTHVVVNASYAPYERRDGECAWRASPLAATSYRAWLTGYVRRRSTIYVFGELDWSGERYLVNATASVNQLMSDWSVNYRNESLWNVGLPMLYPIDFPTCYLFANDVVTFDGLHYQLPVKTGSFVLAHSDNFTVVANRQRGRLASVDVYTSCRNYSILPDCGFQVDAVWQTLPYRNDVVHTAECWTMEGKNVSRLITKTGLQIYYVYDLDCHDGDAIEVSVNGFYYRRMGGLCGNNNNRASEEDEWQASFTDFVGKWGVDNVEWSAVRSRENGSKTGEKACTEAMWSEVTEPIRDEIDIEPFYRACVALVETEKTRGIWKAVCRVMRGLELAAFSRDVILHGCWYDEWSDWQHSREDGGRTVDCRFRKLLQSCKCETDKCDQYQIQCRSKEGSDLFQCQPQFQFGYLYKGITKSKLCMKVDNFPSCPGNCYALGGKEALFRFRCVEESRWQELYSNSVPIVLFPYTPPETCFCHAPCSHY